MTVTTYPTGAVATIERAPRGGWLWSLRDAEGTLIVEGHGPAFTHYSAQSRATHAHTRWAAGRNPKPSAKQRIVYPLARNRKAVWIYDDAKALWWRDFGGGLRGEIEQVPVTWEEEYQWKLVDRNHGRKLLDQSRINHDTQTLARQACYQAWRRATNRGSDHT